MEKEDKVLTNFDEFYPFYLGQHKNQTNRRLHYFGSTLTLIVLIYAIISRTFSLLPACLVIGYGFAWVGHFVFEKNKPATFKYPLWSLRADFRMWKQITLGSRKF